MDSYCRRRWTGRAALELYSLATKGTQESEVQPHEPKVDGRGKVKFQFEFANGEELRLKLYEHLKY